MAEVSRRVWRRGAIAVVVLVALGALLGGPRLIGSKSSVSKGTVTPSSAPAEVLNPPPNPGSDQPAEGQGRVRTGTAQEGCFQDKFDYIEAWNRTGVEPEPCFVAPPPNNQAQPDDVQRTHDGKPF